MENVGDGWNGPIAEAMIRDPKDNAMTDKPWGNRNNLLNSFQSKIEKQTHGRLSHLELEFTEIGFAVVADSVCYYDMQLALHAIQQFSNEHPRVSPTHLELSVNGRAISLNKQDIDIAKQSECPRPLESEFTPSNISVPMRVYKNQSTGRAIHTAALS